MEYCVPTPPMLGVYLAVGFIVAGMGIAWLSLWLVAAWREIRETREKAEAE